MRASLWDLPSYAASQLRYWYCKIPEEWIAQQMPGTKVDEGEDVEEQHHRLRDTECVVRSDRQHNE